MNQKYCDTCVQYSWYWDWCKKWKCQIDQRSVCNEWRKQN